MDLQITDVMFLLARGNLPVKTDCVCEFVDTYYHWSPLLRLAYRLVSF